MVKIAIYDRYLITAGGGERYSCKIAEILSRQEEYSVDLVTDIYADLETVSRRLNLDLGRVGLKVFPFISGDYTKKITSNYDLFINATYLSALPAYGKNNIYLCYFPTPFDVDFRFIHRFLMVFFRLPAVWLFKSADRMIQGPGGIRVEEGIYEPKRFMLKRGSWSSGKALLKVNSSSGSIKIGFKNPVSSGIEMMAVSIKVLKGGSLNREPLYAKDLSLAKGMRRSLEIPLDHQEGEGPFDVLISSDTFVPTSNSKSTADSRKLGVVLYDDTKTGLPKKILMKLLGYIPLFLVNYPRDLKFLETYSRIIAISEYSRAWVKRFWAKDSTILFPPVDVGSFTSGKKEKIILSVGRFFPEHHNKKQLEMAKAFKEMVDKHPGTAGDYTLYLVGGVGRDIRHLEYVEKIKEASKDYPVKVITNMEWDRLVDLFSKSYIFWHASGMGEDEEDHPERFEHFGITTVEAMAAGAIPVVINKGGQKEIIDNGRNGFFFNSWQELENITLKIMKGEVDTARISKNAARDCKKFSNENFEKNMLAIIKDAI